MATVLMIRSHFRDSRMLKEAQSLKNAGYDVKLLVWNRRRERLTGEFRYFSVISVNIPAPKGPYVVLFLPFWLVYLTFHLIREDYDIIHAIDFDTVVPSIVIGKFLRDKLVVYDIFDLYSEQISLPNLLRKVIFQLDLYMMKYADAIILVDAKRKWQLMQFSGVPGEVLNKVVVIMNSPPEKLCENGLSINAGDSGRSFTGAGLRPFIVFYAGVLIRGRFLPEIAEIVGNIKGPVYLEVWGVGEKHIENKLLELATRLGNLKVICSWIPYEKVIAKTLKADVLFAIYDPTIPNNRYASPNKVFEAMLCRKPIIVSKGTLMEKIVLDNKCGIAVEYGNKFKVKESIFFLYSNPKLRRKFGINGRRAYTLKYSWRIMESRLVRMYSNLWGRFR